MDQIPTTKTRTIEVEDHMAAKHTPGPWDYAPTAGNHDFSIYAAETGRRDIALVRDFNEANARLIASAPEMREALLFIIDANARLIDAQAVAENNQDMLAEELDGMARVAGSLLAKIDGASR